MPGHIFDVSYNELIRDPDAKTREILAFCKLPYEPGCADLTRNATPVATLSSAQTRQGLYRIALSENGGAMRHSSSR